MVSKVLLQVTSLEGKLVESEEHAKQFQLMSEANEKALQELNTASEELKNKLNEELDRLKVWI